MASNFRPKSLMFHYVLIKEGGTPSHRLRRNGILHEPRRIFGCHLLSGEKHRKARKIRKSRSGSGENLEETGQRARRGVHEALGFSSRFSSTAASRYLIFVHLIARYSWQAVFKSSWNSYPNESLQKTDYRDLCALVNGV